ncbi:MULTISPECIES: TetR/AcrR family transcriptional regulator [Paenibacillus]|uniref:TetR family transcriptional regulator n=1 Tax=Paenibacillus campinasensis TaxID=66347 RepID=A0A268EHQ6_9BACL|nr:MULTISPECIES: TetR/AcrR family transcriptional regulator [Paenibacillus]PAD72657.1 TetR family transcriptional regulator [Paenibacillus campinasensis]PAK51126.1 TetR family transcriptional regulator [Paenibacillus sp. 7541]
MQSDKRNYHHGNLKETLIRTSLEMIAEHGIQGFSVAKVAKKAGVAISAPYRHFPNRESLLAETGIVFLTELTSRMRTAATEAGNDPIERVASVAGAYVQYALDHNVSFQLFSAARESRLPAFHEQSREMINFLFTITQEAAPEATWNELLELMEALLALVQGFADMFYQGYFSQLNLTKDQISKRSAVAAKLLISGWNQCRKDGEQPL